MGRRVPVPSCLSSPSLPVSALPASPLPRPLVLLPLSPLLPDICFFSNVAVPAAGADSGRDSTVVSTRPGFYFRSSRRQLVSADLLDLFPAELTSFVIFPTLTSKGRGGVRVSHAVTRVSSSSRARVSSLGNGRVATYQRRSARTAARVSLA